MTTGRQLVSTLTADGTLTLELQERTFPAPGPNQVLVRMEAAPINPSDLFLMTTGADFANAQYTPGRMVAQVHPKLVSGQAARHGKPQTVGNEGAGTVIAAGDGANRHRHLLGQRVACVPGNAFSASTRSDRGDEVHSAGRAYQRSWARPASSTR